MILSCKCELNVYDAQHNMEEKPFYGDLIRFLWFKTKELKNRLCDCEWVWVFRGVSVAKSVRDIAFEWAEGMSEGFYASFIKKNRILTVKFEVF